MVSSKASMTFTPHSSRLVATRLSTPCGGGNFSFNVGMSFDEDPLKAAASPAAPLVQVPSCSVAIGSALGDGCGPELCPSAACVTNVEQSLVTGRRRLETSRAHLDRDRHRANDVLRCGHVRRAGDFIVNEAHSLAPFEFSLRPGKPCSA
jgi:hypothetical protein